jgi:hypothetical protein
MFHKVFIKQIRLPQQRSGRIIPVRQTSNCKHNRTLPWIAASLHHRYALSVVKSCIVFSLGARQNTMGCDDTFIGY